MYVQNRRFCCVIGWTRGRFCQNRWFEKISSNRRFWLSHRTGALGPCYTRADVAKKQSNRSFFDVATPATCRLSFLHRPKMSLKWAELRFYGLESKMLRNIFGNLIWTFLRKFVPLASAPTIALLVQQHISTPQLSYKWSEWSIPVIITCSSSCSSWINHRVTNWSWSMHPVGLLSFFFVLFSDAKE